MDRALRHYYFPVQHSNTHTSKMAARPAEDPQHDSKKQKTTVKRKPVIQLLR